jgi:hypothetical protein
MSQRDYIALMPDFLWLIRDFELKLVDDQQQPITEKEYLNIALN